MMLQPLQAVCAPTPHLVVINELVLVSSQDQIYLASSESFPASFISLYVAPLSRTINQQLQHLQASRAQVRLIPQRVRDIGVCQCKVACVTSLQCCVEANHA